MSMSTSVHMKNAVEFEIKGSANHSHAYGAYPVVTIEFRDEVGSVGNGLNLFMNTEQLMALQKAIKKAIRDADLLSDDMERKSREG